MPSGDQLGLSSSAAWAVTLTCPVPSGFITKTSSLPAGGRLSRRSWRHRATNWAGATVTARTDAEVDAIDRGEFIAAVTGHSVSAEAADRLMDQQLAMWVPEPDG